MSIHSFLELVEEKGGNEWQKKKSTKKRNVQTKEVAKGSWAAWGKFSVPYKGGTMTPCNGSKIPTTFM